MQRGHEFTVTTCAARASMWSSCSRVYRSRRPTASPWALGSAVCGANLGLLTELDLVLAAQTTLSW